jgi:hypothetical protein
MLKKRSEGEVIREKYVSAFYIFYIWNSSSLSWGFRCVEPEC